MTKNNLQSEIFLIEEVVNVVPLTGKKIPQKEYCEEGAIPIIDQGAEFVNGYTNDASKVIGSPGPKIVFGDHTRVVKFIETSFAPGADGIKVLTAKPFCNPRYLYYYIKYKVAQMGDRGYARHFQHLKKAEIKLPSLAIQAEIVEIIESLLIRLNMGVDTLLNAERNLLVYRKSMLESAFFGRLLKPRQYQNDRSILKYVISPSVTNNQLKEIKQFNGMSLPNLPENWIWVPLSDLINSIDQGWSPKCENNSAAFNEWAVIKTTAIQSAFFNKAHNKKLPQSLAPKLQHILRKGDILVTRAGPRTRVGICCLVKEDLPFLLNCDKAYRLRVNQTLCKPEYIECVLNSPFISSIVEKIKSGINDSGLNLNQKAFLSVPIPYCQINEQQKILSNVELQISRIKSIEETIVSAVKSSKLLEYSIFNRLFELNDHDQILKLQRAL